MSNRGKDNIETLIPQQLIRDAEPFIEFLKEYYNFLNQEGGPNKVIDQLTKNTDLDHAVDQFVQYIYKEVGFGMAAKLAANKVNLYKHIDEFYKAKGSVDSFKLLFRLLFNKEIEIELPKESILIASDGKWDQQTIIFVNVINGSVFDAVNDYIVLTNTDNTKVVLEIERVRFIKDNIYELTIAKGFNGVIKENAIIVEDTFSGLVVNSLSNFEIIQAGRNFRVGQVLEISDGVNDATKSLIKVTKVNGVGGVLAFEFIRFGLDYSSEFISYLSPINYDLDFESDPADYGLTADKFGRVFDNVNTKEYLKLELNPYSSGYFLSTYTEDSVSYGENNIYESESSTRNDLNYGIIGEEDLLNYESFPNKAVVKFTNQPVARYGGSYKTNNGFLSDSIILQDNAYYQAYSYVIKTDERFSDYEDAVRKTVHPSGFALFGQYQITNQLDVSTHIDILVKFFSERLIDVVDTVEYVAKLIIKPVEDEIITSDFDYYELRKPLVHSVEITDDVAKLFTKKPHFETMYTFDRVENKHVLKAEFDIVLTSQFVYFLFERSITDSIGALDEVIAEEPNVYANNYFAQEYSEGLTATGLEWQLGKVLNHSIVTAVDRPEFNHDKNGIYSFVYPTEQHESFMTKPLPGDTITTSELETNNVTKLLSTTALSSDSLSSVTTKISIDTSTTSDDADINFLKNPSDIITTGDSGRLFDLTKGLSTTQITSDSLSSEVEKELEDSINTSEFGLIEFNPYSPGYFASDYIEGLINF